MKSLRLGMLSRSGRLLLALACAVALVPIVWLPTWAFRALGPETMRAVRWPFGLCLALVACASAYGVFWCGAFLLRRAGLEVVRPPAPAPDDEIFS